MKIVLIEDRPNSPELSFQQDLIKLGRDPNECQIVFDREKHPMVSRSHAEIRHHQNSWILIDKNSSYGTFLNGKRVAEAQPIQIGSAIQIGADGPTLIVIVLEVGGVSVPVEKKPMVPPPPVTQAKQQPAQPQDIPKAQPARRQEPKPPPIPSSQPVQRQEVKPPPIPVSQPVPPKQNFPPIPSKLDSIPSSSIITEPQLEFVGKDVPPFKMTKAQIWLGRETNCEVVLDPKAAMVSRKHADISRHGRDFVLTDNNSFNGTLVNNQRISAATPLYHGDEIQFGMGGPILKFILPQQVAPKGSSLAGQRAVASDQNVNFNNSFMANSPKTMVFRGDLAEQIKQPKSSADSQLLMSLTFGSKTELTIGRDEKNDISLDGLQISNHHARLLKNSSGIFIEDLKSANGVYINGKRISKQIFNLDDAVQIGSFLIKVDENGTFGVFDTRSKTRIDCVNITKEVKNRAGGGKIKLVDGVSLSIQPNEFIGLLGPSGAGKSTLMDALNGMRPATDGSVLINNLELYQHLDSLKQSIGYVPQEDIIHRELSVYRTLYYVAKLRLSNDVSKAEIDQIIDEILDVTGLTERRDVPVSQLSGGQRKRVSIAVELITKPSVIFLDEPTSGLDPATEEKIMKLFRQIAESGRTVILTTHAMENVRLFDKIVVLMRGKLVFYGKPEEALTHLGAKNFKELYDRLENPVEEAIEKEGEARRLEITERVAENWKQKFVKTSQFKANVEQPLKQIGQVQSSGVHKKHKLGIFGAIRQWFTLSRRYLEVLLKDKLNLFILFAQAPIIAFLTLIVLDSNEPRDSAYFVLALVSIWFGTSVSAREIIRERPIYKRERMINLGIFPYLFSKLFVLGIIVGVQCLMLFIPLKMFDLVGIMKMPGDLLGIPQFWAMLLSAGVGIAIGLFISALVKTSEMATSLVPLILIPQILFSGLFGVPSGISKVVGLTMPATWSFDTMKRFSSLDTLQEEGAEAKGKSKGLGLYKSIEDENEKIVDEAKGDIDKYRREAEWKILSDYKPGQSFKLDDPPLPKDAMKIPEDLSDYINFLHPWMNEILNQIVLMIMFLGLVVITLIILRIQDIG